MPGPGRIEHDPRAWLAAAFDTGREAIEEATGAEVAAVGIGALGPAPLLVDEDLEPLTPAPLFALDRRAEAERARLGVSGDHALPKLLWWREHEPEAHTRAAWALDATGFLVAALTGRPTMDSITQLAYEHPEADPPVPLPPPVDPAAKAGALRPEAARRLGLAAGTPVAAGTFDTYVDIVGLGAEPGTGCLLLGSTLAVYAVVEEEAAPVDGLELTPYPGPGLLLGGTNAAAGSALAWLADLLRLDEQEIASAAGIEPGSAGLLALPYVAGERAPFVDPDARAALTGLSLGTRRADVYRAFVDALALAVLSLAELLPPCDAWRAAGGGTRDGAWLAATCDALAAPVEVVAHAGEAVGPARLALRSIGLDPPVQVERVVEPDAARSQALRALAGRHRDLYARLEA